MSHKVKTQSKRKQVERIKPLGVVPLGVDFTVQNEGSIVLLQPQNEAAITWVEEKIGRDNGYQPYYPTVLIEARYIGDIIDGIQADGLTIQ